jgi:dihydropteroate synthase
VSENRLAALLQQKSSPLVMGVVNASPNSFYGATQSITQAIQLVEQMVEAGVDIVDIGGEATNPQVLVGSISEQTEYELVLPLVEHIRANFPVAISVDTSKYTIMRDALAAGADMINDQRALMADGAVELIAKADAFACIMYSFTDNRVAGSTLPQELMQNISSVLAARVASCVAAGISKDKLFVDPGFGQGNYGKSTAENFYILAHLRQLTKIGCRVLSGWSRKSMIGAVTGRAVDARLPGSLAAVLFALMQGATIVRVHDVSPTIDVVKMFNAYIGACGEGNG